MSFYSYLHKRLKIKVRMTLLTGFIVFFTVSLLSATIFIQMRTILLEKTFDVCRNLALHIANQAREELLINEIYEMTRSSIKGIQQESATTGLLNSYVIDNDYHIVAHTNSSRTGTQIPLVEQEYYASLDKLSVRELKISEKQILSFAYPIFVTVYKNSSKQKHRVGTGVFEFDRDEIYAPVRRLGWIVFGVSSILFVIAIILTVLIAQRLSRPVEKLVDASRSLAAGKLGYQLENIPGGEIGELSSVFNDMSRSLKDMEDIRSKQAALSREMEIARGIQLAVLPANGTMGNYEFVGYMQTADDVGGDYYDCIHIKYRKKDYWWLVIGDVSGHGLPSGLIMLMAQTAIQTALSLSPGLDPDEVIIHINQVLYENIRKLNEQKYMTATLYRLDSKGQLHFAGLHQDTIIYRSSKNELELHDSRGMWLGVEHDLTKMTPLDKLKLNKGDLLFLYTDGIIEAFNQSGQMYSEKRLLRVLQKYGQSPLEEIKQKLIQDLERFGQGRPYEDDITFALMRRQA